MRFIYGFLSICLLFQTPPASYAASEQQPSTIDCTSALLSLFEGRRFFDPDLGHYSLDPDTRRDVKVLDRVFPGLNNTRTFFGGKRLAWLLQNPPLNPQLVQNRQNAVRELLENENLRVQVREQLDLLNKIIHVYFSEKFKDFNNPILQGDPLFLSLVGAFATFPIIMGFAIKQPSFGLMSLYFLMLLNGHFVQKQDLARNRLVEFKKIFEISKSLDRILQSSQAEELRKIQHSLSALSNPSHSLSLVETASALESVFVPKGRMSRVAVWSGNLAFGLSAHTLRPTLDLVLRDREKISALLGALADLDVFLSLAEYGEKHRGQVVFPQILDQPDPYLNIQGGHHPYLFVNNPKSVANDITLGAPPSANGNTRPTIFVIITGPNAGGKSTYLQMIATTTLQAQIGGLVPAQEVVLTPVELITNIDISDSIEDGKSFFRAEARRLSEILQRLPHQPHLLVIMDEILLGTNARDRHALERAVIKYLAASGSINLLATHDIRVATLESEVSGISNAHVETIPDPETGFRFSFRIVPGSSEHSTAFNVLRQEGVSESLIQEALRYLDEPETP